MKIPQIVTLLLIIALNGHAQIQHAMTYNLRFDSPHDGENIWDNRKAELVELLKYYAPDVVGTQEGLHDQLAYIKSNWKGYDYIGVGRDDGQKLGEYAAIFYNTHKFKVKEQGTFWLSPTPEKISKGWGANINRVCTYGIFENKVSGQAVLVVNAHFDHESATAREESAKLMVNWIQSKNTGNLPVIVMGDFNCLPSSNPIDTFNSALDDAGSMAPNGIYGPVGTFSGFDTEAKLDRRIDYIFVNRLEVYSYRHIDDLRKNRLWPSDHLPVMIQLK